MTNAPNHSGARINKPYDRRRLLKQLGAFAVMPSISSSEPSLEDKANFIAWHLDKSPIQFHDDARYNYNRERININLYNNRRATVMYGALSTVHESVKEERNIEVHDRDWSLNGSAGPRLVNPGALHVIIYDDDLEIAHLYDVGSGYGSLRNFKYHGVLDGVVEFKPVLHKHSPNEDPVASSLGNTEDWREDFETVIDLAYHEVLERRKV